MKYPIGFKFKYYQFQVEIFCYDCGVYSIWSNEERMSKKVNEAQIENQLRNQYYA